LRGVIDSHGERGPTIDDLEAIEETVDKVKAALVIIDPLMGHLPDSRDSHRDHDVRRALGPLSAMAARRGVAIVVIRHLNKGMGGGNPLYRGGGSIGIIGHARAGLVVAPDPNDPDNGPRILAVTKSNLAALAASLAYRIEAADETSRIAWEGTTDHTAPELLALQLRDDERSRVDEAIAFLTDFLAGGDQLAQDVKKAARSAGIADATLARARSKVCNKPQRIGFGPKAYYVWSLHAFQNPHAFQPTDLEKHDKHEKHGGGNGLVAHAETVFRNRVSELRPSRLAAAEAEGPAPA
jgi:hypothetical protein